MSHINYRFSHLSVSDGLSPGAVNCFYKDINGFMWIGTSSGLNRYDGYTIKTYNPDPADSLALQSKDYKKIFGDPLGNIWVQTAWGINIFDPSTETFSADQYSLLKEMGLQQEPVKDIIKDSCGNYWFLQQGSGITKYIPGSEGQAPTVAFRNEFLLYGKEITSFAETSDGNFWIIYNDGILEKIHGETLEVLQRNKRVASNFKKNLHDFKLLVDDDDDLWIHLYEDYGVFYYNTSKDELKNFSTATRELQLSSDLIKDVVKDPSGNIWIGTDHGGINIIDKDDFTITYINNHPEIENSLAHNSTLSLYRDYDGLIWVGTFKNGVDFYHRNVFKFPHHENIISDPHSLPFNDVNIFTEDDEGNLWIGTNGGGLIHLDRKTWRYTQYLHDPDDPASISSNIIVSLLYDKRGNLWAGTYLEGLNRFNGKGFVKYRHDSENPESLGGNSVWELFEDSRGYMWIGTLHNGLDMFDHENEVFIHSKDHDGGSPLHNSGYISAIEEDKDGNIWVGGGNGVDVFNPHSGERLFFSSILNNPESLSSNYILSIYRDSKDNMWIGTEEGLDLYNPLEKNFYHYTQQDGLPGRNVISIIEDNCENLWLTSSYGISQFRKNKKDEEGRILPNFRNYDDLDGLQGKLFNENAIFKTSLGELVVGGLNGFNMFNPRDFGFNLEPPKLAFTSFNLFNEEVKPYKKTNGRVILEDPIHETSHISLKYDENLFSIEFAALDFFQPTRNNYQYKLEGFDQEWQEAGSNSRKVTYTNLDPGEYVFRVKASNNDQVWNNAGISMGITVLPPFYKTIYAYITYILLAAGILYFARRRVVLRQREKFQIEQDKREADQLHQVDLMKIRFFTNISHEFKGPLSLILAPIDKIRGKVLNPEAREQLEVINRNAQRLLNLINQILDLGNIENDPLLSTTKDNVIAFIEQIVSSFRSLADNKGISISFKSRQENFYTSFDTDKLDKILFNLLSNAVKFTPRLGNINVVIDVLEDDNLALDKKVLEIRVIDSGIGIAEEDRSKIFDRFYKVDQPGESMIPGSGIGLSLVKEYVGLYRGRIKVESEPGKGSAFIVKIPFEELHEGAVAENYEKGSNNSAASVINRKISPREQELASVLMIEDDEEVLSYLAENLKKYFNVFVARNGEEGWKKTLAVQPDLIICDWMMPVMKGPELCEKIRSDSRTKHIPFILLTGKKEEEKALFALKVGVSDYITKPFNFDLLLTRIQNLISQRRAFQQAYSKKINVSASKVQIECPDDKFIRKALELIDDNLNNSDFSVEVLATQLNVSRTFLYNKFVTKVEKSPLELIQDLRMERGKELLKKSQLTIAEIAFEVGYNNPKYFTKNFKKKYKMLPSQFRSEV